jgi:hypothetical protein
MIGTALKDLCLLRSSLYHLFFTLDAVLVVEFEHHGLAEM